MHCSRCEEDKPVSEFYFRRTEGRHHAYCKRCHNRYTHERFKQRKARAIAYKGGICADCRGTFHYAVFEFHHTDPTRKELTGNQLKRLAWETVKAELDHCELLCANCHRLRHWDDR